MNDQDPLAEVKARWFTDDQHRAEYWADLASRDVPWLVEQVEQWRQAAGAEAYLADERGREIARLRGLLLGPERKEATPLP